MDTVKVDIEKLQLLSDRIDQAIEAIAQVRRSAHGYLPGAGLQHSAPVFAMQAGAPGVTHPLVGGLRHSSSVWPLLIPPQAAAFAPQEMAELLSQGLSVAQPPIIPFGVEGLSHTSYDRPTDPGLIRLLQQCPFAFSSVPVFP